MLLPHTQPRRVRCRVTQRGSGRSPEGVRCACDVSPLFSPHTFHSSFIGRPIVTTVDTLCVWGSTNTASMACVGCVVVRAVCSFLRVALGCFTYTINVTFVDTLSLIYQYPLLHSRFFLETLPAVSGGGTGGGNHPTSLCACGTCYSPTL